MARLKSFGQTIRALRETKQISLRAFAATVGMSATYLSKVERDNFPPPGEEKILAIAKALGEDGDELLALAGRVASDLPVIIQQHPKAMASFVRATKGLSTAEIERLARQVLKRKC